MARRTARQKLVHSLLTAYQRIKRLKLHQRRRTGRRQSTDADHPMDTDSDDSSTTPGSPSLSSLTYDSLSSLSLSRVDMHPDQDDAASGTHLDIPTSGSSMDLDMSSDDSSDDSVPLASKRQQGPRGLTYHVRKAVSTIYSSRYHRDRKFGHGRPPASLPLILTTYKDDDEFHHMFQQWLRINPITFDKILDEIGSNPLFINRSRHPQMPIDYQLAITLFRFGHYGNAAGLQRVADWAGVGKGTVLVATRRVMGAILRSSFKDQAIRIPTPGEKEEAKQWVEKCSKCPAWRDGWCFVDGTLVPLAFRPFWFGQSYFDRKCNYSLNIQVDDTLYGMQQN